MKLTLLGSGTPAPSLLRAGAGYVVEIGDDVIVIDHGPGAHMRFLEAGFTAKQVTHFFLSHLHFDHCADLPRLFHHHWTSVGGLAPGIKLFGPFGFTRFLERLFGPDGAYAPDIYSRIKAPIQRRLYEASGGSGERPWPDLAVRELKNGEIVSATCWQLRVAEVPHYRPYLANLGMRLESQASTLAYSSDVSLYPEITLQHPSLRGLRSLAANVDVLVHYLSDGRKLAPLAEGHPRAALPIRPGLVGELADQANVQTLIASHLSPTMDDPCSRSLIEAEIRRHFRGRFIWGNDGLSLSIE